MEHPELSLTQLVLDLKTNRRHNAATAAPFAVQSQESFIRRSVYSEHGVLCPAFPPLRDRHDSLSRSIRHRL
jgi:hypothetical protein